MSKRGIPFTPVQLGLCLLNGAGLIFCAGGDLFLLMFDRGTVSKTVIVTNLVLSLLTVLICGWLIKRAGDMDLFDEGDSGDRLPAIVALRTYFCMIASDITGVLILMLAGALVWQNAGKIIPVYATLMFAAAGGIYYWRTSQMGSAEDAENAEIAEEKVENSADTDVQAEASEPAEEQAAKVDISEISEMQLVPIDALDDMSDKMDIFDELLDKIELLNEQEANAKASPEQADKSETPDEQAAEADTLVEQSDNAEISDETDTTDEQADKAETSDEPAEKAELSDEQADNDNDDNAAAAEELNADTDKE